MSDPWLRLVWSEDLVVVSAKWNLFVQEKTRADTSTLQCSSCVRSAGLFVIGVIAIAPISEATRLEPTGSLDVVIRVSTHSFNGFLGRQGAPQIHKQDHGVIWELPKIGDPNIVPYLVGSLLEGPQNKVPPFSETPICYYPKLGRLSIGLSYPKGPSTQIVGFQGPKVLQSSMEFGTYNPTIWELGPSGIGYMRVSENRGP